MAVRMLDAVEALLGAMLRPLGLGLLGLLVVVT